MVASPEGYKTPRFPDLYWPLGWWNDKDGTWYLYHTRDVWKFTTYWSLIMMIGIYTASACIILLTHYWAIYRHPCNATLEGSEGMRRSMRGGRSYREYFVESLFKGNTRLLVISVCLFIFLGALQGFIAGTVIGVMISAVYNSAQFKMTTGIPFVYALIITLYHVAESYSFTVKNM